jgi:HEAT repeat protein
MRRAPAGARGAAAALLACAFVAGCSGDADTPSGPAAAEPGETAGAAPADPALPRQAVRDLAARGPGAEPSVRRLLEHPRDEVRLEAAVVYPRVARGDAAPALAKTARSDPNPDVRAAAVTAIGHMRAMDEMDAVIAALEDDEPLVRQRAADTVFRILGRRYDVNVSPQDWKRTVAEIRELWRSQEGTIRDYYQRRRRPAPQDTR